MTQATPSPARAADLSPEVLWYLKDRGFPLPTCPPLWRTPEPNMVKGAVFDPARVDRVLGAFHHLRHTQGQWAGKPLDPDPWQVAYVIAPVFGWVAPADDGTYARIVRKLYVEIPRKNGKTTLMGGVLIYLTAGDGEPGAQVIAAASTKDQAKFCFDPIKALADKAPALKGHVKSLASKITHPASSSYFTVVSSVADAQHGANLHGGGIDELHVHKTPDLVETIETGTGSRRQPLILIITTADDSRQNTIYSRKRERIEALARGAHVDPATYGVVWAAEREDDPFAESTWKKANPGYGVSPTRSYMQSAAAEAQQSPADLAKFLRLHLGIRTKQETKFLLLEDWDRNAATVDEERLKGRKAIGGIDLASTSDLCALAWLFPDGDGYDVLFRFWAPEDQLKELDRRTAGEASVWVREGFLTLTPGAVVDYGYIRNQVNADRVSFEVDEIAFDPWNATGFVSDLIGDEAPMVEIRQGYKSLSPSLKELRRLLQAGTVKVPLFRHGGNPVMRWMVDNLAVTMDPGGNVKPDKAKSAEKIDGVSAAVTGLARAMLHEPPEVHEIVNF